MDARTRRIADNESRFRDINERLEADLRRLPVDGDPVDFVCECGKLECSATVPLTLDEYERVRQDSATFAVLPGHEIGDVEDVVHRSERFFVVRKHVESRPIAEGSDRRTG